MTPLYTSWRWELLWKRGRSAAGLGIKNSCLGGISKKFPELTYCEGNWKLTKIISNNYPAWYANTKERDLDVTMEDDKANGVVPACIIGKHKLEKPTNSATPKKVKVSQDSLDSLYSLDNEENPVTAGNLGDHNTYMGIGATKDRLGITDKITEVVERTLIWTATTRNRWLANLLRLVTVKTTKASKMTHTIKEQVRQLWLVVMPQSKQQL
ncbi:hypothetical protein SERLADRAFT_404764 [Serpula lacrymans var. lacrymans S7.9]|uniref:Uncharacterized protein n=1 Tax=Serpula lacrymans var. lacrymans (strain S7.9) TaxID=578457 RepID=F8NCW5_SERL9|nr:uncharacterized protein SERLADRAFT_404764 [Serpula lacrymans var. lacrymans S7.9]EGO30709.1 hypothetical protein SERLADRAFT_404764 [Serpula lacrymans var. lacrymans S7.9]